MLSYANYVDIKGYEGLYAVNSQGKVFSYISSKILKPWLTLGYQYVTLCKDKIKTSYRVSRLVAVAFIPNPQNKPEINHIDGIKTNNDMSNLEWVTGSENKLHAYKIGLHTSDRAICAMKKSRRLLSTKQASEIRKLYSSGGYFYRELGEMFGVSLDTIYHVVKRMAYAEVQ
jgi:hypothetical protein